MNFLNKLQRKYGKYAIRNLPTIMIVTYVIGYVLYLFLPGVMRYLTLEPYYILHGQIWRLVSWVLIPPESFSLFTIVMLVFYYSLGKTLENTWGPFRFNVYIFSGIVFTVIGAFVLYFIMGSGRPFGIGSLFSTYYINMSIFLAFAVSYPNMEVLLMFIIPIKMKWMGLLYAVLILYDFVRTNWVGRVAIIASLLNFILYLFIIHPAPSPQQVKRRQEFKRNVSRSSAPKMGPKHRCYICGRTEKDGDNLEFRFCSKCEGDYEYCQDHLFTHEHIRKH